MGRKKMFASSARAQQELGFRIVPVYPAMRAAIEWFRANGYAPQAQRMTRVAIIAAMPGELKPLVRGWPHSAPQRRPLLGPAQRGRGVDRCLCRCRPCAATRAFAAIEDGGPVDLVISDRLGGRSDAPNRGRQGLQRRRRHRRSHRRALLCERAPADSWLATSPRVADESEKRASPQPTRRGLVDMEAAAIARLAAMRGIPFYASRESATASTRSSLISIDLSHADGPVPDCSGLFFLHFSGLVLACAHPDGRK